MIYILYCILTEGAIGINVQTNVMEVLTSRKPIMVEEPCKTFNFVGNVELAYPTKMVLLSPNWLPIGVNEGVC